MTQEEFKSIMDQGMEHHRAGRPGEADAWYRQALAAQPDNPVVLHMRGVLAYQCGQYALAGQLMERLVALQPNNAEAHNNLGNALRVNGNLAAATAEFQRALALRPDFPEALSNLGNAFREVKQHEQAIGCFKRALAINPQFVEALSNLGNTYTDLRQWEQAASSHRRALELAPNRIDTMTSLALCLRALGKLNEAEGLCRRVLAMNPNSGEAHVQLGGMLAAARRYPDAITHFRRAIELQPKSAVAHAGLGLALWSIGQQRQAVESCQRALSINPNLAEAHNLLGVYMADIGKLEDAMACFRRAVELQPEFPDAHGNLGNTLRDLNRAEEAIPCHRRALALNPNYVEAYSNLGNAYKDTGLVSDAIASYGRAVQMRPTQADAASNRLYTMLFHPDYDMPALFAAAQEWDRNIALPLRQSIAEHTNDRSPERRLRIGYVSPDFREHCQSLFTIPLLSNHNHEQFEVFCYSSSAPVDTFTNRLRSQADQWRDVLGISNDKLGEMVRADKIDILIDLTMHMAKHRLLLFATKPAPVQVSYLAYPGTTGVATIDYRFTDPRLDPPGLFDAYYSEKTIRLPDTFWCYDPLIPAGKELDANQLPALSAGHITFGCLNNFCKVSEPTLDLWAEVLRAVPNSRLRLLVPSGSARGRVAEKLKTRGIDPSRIDLVGRQGRTPYLREYQTIDLGLDTIPYNGHTTSLDSYWMGVPVVTLVGNTVVGRAGLSQLHNLGLPELCTESPEQFVRLAQELAGDLPRLAEYRRTLRDRMKASPLMDAKKFVGHVESAYRNMWRTYVSS